MAASAPDRSGERRAARRASRLGLVAFALAAVLSAPVFATASEQEPGTTGRIAQNSDGEADPAAAIALRRDGTRRELEELSKTITLSQDKVRELEVGIDRLAKDRASLREAIVQSARARQEMEAKILAGEKRLAEMRGEEEAARASLHERRGLLAEVLAALQRMGRNPPPAILVTPDDALGSVRSAILLGAVVPGIRAETDKLVADLQKLIAIRNEIGKEKADLATAMGNRLEEEKRSQLLISENEALAAENTRTLEAERRRSDELAGRATSLEGLIGSMEREIASVREAAALARVQEAERAKQTEDERRRAREAALSASPDKNRIAPAYPFSELQKRLAFPVAGDAVRQFGDADGTGHSSQGLILATNAGALVTAPADGWVVFAGTFRSYGRMVILNVGDDYHLVLSGMDRVNVREGQFVVAGEPLAVMGEKRVASVNALALETDRPTLYIEFRKNGKPVDPRPWWTASVSGKVRDDS
ncbi:murein hydrolase activator EnvC family protein [Mycoplana rhizolycopersici]|uniref:Murein hydrolase activator EnvC n=1 Tax=Mycoplana rhizolycopersici TaxID=2746702 RepID=A0ABX2QA19_9HYPH|nr:murein hydrolase activator EnvC [Rhizobium rhizolycopersici]NVP54013.1 murein hydrolase activator EnvC [Rhizobium rhizolycopersici]